MSAVSSQTRVAPLSRRVRGRASLVAVIVATRWLSAVCAEFTRRARSRSCRRGLIRAVPRGAGGRPSCTQSQDAPSHPALDQELELQELPDQELLLHELPDQELPDQELPDHELALHELPDQELPLQDEPLQLL